MGFLSNDRDQGHLLGYSMGDFVPKDAKCRFIVSMVGRLNLAELYNRYSEQGNDAFEPGIMLASWFFAYAEGITSTRRLEELCNRDLHYMYVSALLRPDHTSLSRFRQRHVDLLPQYFQQIVTLAMEEGISDFKVISIDGTKMQATGSLKHMKNHKALSEYLDGVRKDIDRYLGECEEADGEKLQTLDAKAELLEERLKELEKRQNTIKEEYREAHQIHLLEPDACLMQKVNGTQSLPAYNGQISVDAKSHIIVACELVQDRNDREQFKAQHQSAERTLGADPERQYVADAGYHSKVQLQYIYDHQIHAIIADPTPMNRSIATAPTEEEQFRRSDFVYEPETDLYFCPLGHPLKFLERYRRGNWEGRIYQAKDCVGCALRPKCMPKAKAASRMKRIRREDREHYAEQMAVVLATPEAHQLLRIRRSSVEPVFGNIKANLGFRRFALRGLSKAAGEFALMAIAHNLNTLFNKGFATFLRYFYTLCDYFFGYQRTLCIAIK